MSALSPAARQKAAKRARRPTSVDAMKAILKLEIGAVQEVDGLKHLAELLELLGVSVGTPYQNLSDLEVQKIGDRIEYLSGLVKRHAVAIDSALREIRGTVEQWEGGAA